MSPAISTSLYNTKTGDRWFIIENDGFPQPIAVQNYPLTEQDLKRDVRGLIAEGEATA